MRAGARILALAADPGNCEAFVAGAVERWLRQAPDGPIEYGSPAARRAVALLIESWSAALVHALTREPMTRAELEGTVEGLDRRALQRQLDAMRGIGMVETLGSGAGALYEMTVWLRLGIAPLIAAARRERSRRMSGATPVDGLDVDAGFRMALGVAELPEALSGACRLRLNLDEDRDDRLSGVTARIERGEVVSIEASIEPAADAWALGTLDGWLDTVIDLEAGAVRTGGDAWLTGALVAAIHAALFGPR